MSNYQTAGNVLVALKRESTTGTAPTTVTGATQLRITDSPGLELRRAVIQSRERRADGTTSMGRIGGKTVEGSYNMELTAGGGVDILLEAIMRGTWATSTSVAFASVVQATNEITWGGDWVSSGVRVGDIFRLTGTAANDNLNLRAVALTSGTLSVPSGSLTAEATALSTGTLTILKKLTTPTTPTRYSHTVEQYDKDLDLSELFLGCRVTGFSISCRPNQPATGTVTFLGMDRTALATGTSPYFTSPTLTTNLMLAADDSSIRFNGTDVSDFTGFDLNFTINAAGEPVIGSFVTPDVFDNDLSVTGTITGLRSDFANITLYDAETEFELSILLQELETAPKSCLSIFLPRVKIAALTAPAGGGDGAKVETRTLMIGPKESATGYNTGIAVIASSEA